MILEGVAQYAGTGDLGRQHRGEVGLAHVDQQLVVDRSCGMDDTADRSAPAVDVVAQPRRDLRPVAHIDTGGADLGAEPFDRLDGADRGEDRVIPGDCRPPAPRRDDASAQQGDVPRAALGQIGRRPAAERPGAAGDDVGRVGVSLVGKRLRQLGAGRNRGTNVSAPRMAI